MIMREFSLSCVCTSKSYLGLIIRHGLRIHKWIFFSVKRTNVTDQTTFQVALISPRGKRVTRISGGKHPFYAPSAAPQHYSVPKDPISTKNHGFPIFCSKCLNLVIIQFLSIKIGQNSGSENLIWAKISSASKIFLKKSVHQGPNLAAIRSTRPHFRPFESPYQNYTSVKVLHTHLCLLCEYPLTSGSRINCAFPLSF